MLRATRSHWRSLRTQHQHGAREGPRVCSLFQLGLLAPWITCLPIGRFASRPLPPKRSGDSLLLARVNYCHGMGEVCADSMYVWESV